MIARRPLPLDSASFRPLNQQSASESEAEPPNFLSGTDSYSTLTETDVDTPPESPVRPVSNVDAKPPSIQDVCRAFQLPQHVAASFDLRPVGISLNLEPAGSSDEGYEAEVEGIVQQLERETRKRVFRPQMARANTSWKAQSSETVPHCSNEVLRPEDVESLALTTPPPSGPLPRRQLPNTRVSNAKPIEKPGLDGLGLGLPTPLFEHRRASSISTPTPEYGAAPPELVRLRSSSAPLRSRSPPPTPIILSTPTFEGPANALNLRRTLAGLSPLSPIVAPETPPLPRRPHLEAVQADQSPSPLDIGCSVFDGPPAQLRTPRPRPVSRLTLLLDPSNVPPPPPIPPSLIGSPILETFGIGLDAPNRPPTSRPRPLRRINAASLVDLSRTKDLKKTVDGNGVVPPACFSALPLTPPIGFAEDHTM